MHHVQLSGSGNYVIDNYTSFTIPRNIEIVPTSGKGKTISLLTATNPLEEFQMPGNHCRVPSRQPTARPTYTTA